MTVAGRWICRVCWKSNWPDADRCKTCGSPRDLEEGELEAQRLAVAERAAQPEPVPDLLVALPAVVFRAYARVWTRGGVGLLAIVGLMLFAGVTDVGLLLFSVGVCAGLFIFGVAAGEVSDGMRGRELWSYIAGIVMSVVAIVGSTVAFNAFAPGLVDPNAVRWGSILIFGASGLAAAAGLVLLVTHRDKP
jgi:hypothetical protein